LTARDCFEKGLDAGVKYGCDGRYRLAATAKEAGFESPIDYLSGEALEMGLSHPLDYVIGVLTVVGVVEGFERFYDV